MGDVRLFNEWGDVRSEDEDGHFHPRRVRATMVTSADEQVPYRSWTPGTQARCTPSTEIFGQAPVGHRCDLDRGRRRCCPRPQSYCNHRRYLS